MNKATLLTFVRNCTAAMLALVLCLCGVYAPLACAEEIQTEPEIPGIPLMTKYAQMDFPEIYSAAVPLEVIETEAASIISAVTFLGEQEIDGVVGQ